jgi:hypothetical protein
MATKRAAKRPRQPAPSAPVRDPEPVDPTLARRVKALVGEWSVPEVLEALAELCGRMARPRDAEWEAWAFAEQELRRTLKRSD